MNPRDFDPDITKIVDELREAGGIITGLHIRRLDGTAIGAPLKEERGTYWVPAERALAMREYATSPPAELPRMPKK